jgi:hypothetical protein
MIGTGEKAGVSRASIEDSNGNTVENSTKHGTSEAGRSPISLLASINFRCVMVSIYSVAA